MQAELTPTIGRGRLRTCCPSGELTRDL
uniref:Uncharacterized protein n=1 Tax=Anguilla anguilla TaxID=7936 RepID=A0A0E9T996_ANGAN